jgi:hypothetical protein
MKKLIITALLAATPSLSQAAVNLIHNGGFESPVQASGTWANYDTIADWNTLSGVGVEVRNNVIGSAHGGNNFVELDAASNGWISQAFATVAGQDYNLSFWYSPRAGVGANSNGIDVFINDDMQLGLTANGVGHNGNVWSQHLLTFTAGAGPTTTLSFFAAGNSDGLGGSLDDVSVTAAVPEPETYALMLGGLVLVGFSARRRSDKTKA